MFSAIHPTYDFLNHLLSFNRDRVWRKRTRQLVAPQQGEKVLAVCCGTADLALEFRDQAGLIVGADFTTLGGPGSMQGDDL